MNRNKTIIYITITAIVLIISIPTIYTIVKKYNDRLITVTHKRIEEAARECYLKNICLDDKITLKQLYDNKYLEKESNPITKEYYTEESYVERKDKTFNFIEVP